MSKSIVTTNLTTFFAIDLGMKRTGIATGNKLLRQATPRGTIKAEGKQRLLAIHQQLQHWQPDAIIVGVPRYKDGAEHEMTKQALRLCRQLREQTRLPVFEIDERYSSTAAIASGCKDVDAGAACVILEQFFNEYFEQNQL